MQSGESAAPAGEGSRTQADPEARRPGSPRLLVADNGLESVEQLARIFADAGYEVRTAINADGALAAARQGVDVAVIDLRLPNSSAIELMLALRKLELAPQVILLTGTATREAAIAALKLGALDYLIRPCSEADLLGAVRKAVWQAQLNASGARRSRTSGSAIAQADDLWRAANQAPVENRSSLAVRDDLRRNAHLNNELAMLEAPRGLCAQAVPCNGLIDAALELIQADAARLRISIEQELLPGLPPLAGDREQIKSALVNLLVNALDATPSGNRIRLSARAEGGYVILAVDDSGAGIPFGLRSRVFDASFSSKRQGTGLGLAMIRSIAAAHRGKISVEESKLGGARFVLRLPAWITQTR
jgi:signal transduction histidine kinase